MRKSFPLLPFLLPLSLLFSLGIACFVERRIFWDAFALNDDVRNQVYWMAKILNPHLFTNDYIANYFTQPALVSPVLNALYEASAQYLHPLVVSQFLPFILVVAATFFLFKFCERYCSPVYAAWICFTFNVSIWIFKNLAGGLSRAFFYPLFFFLLWKMQTKQWRYVAPALWLSASLYPPVFLLGMVLLLIEIWVHRHPNDKNQPPENHSAEKRARIQCFIIALVGSLAGFAWRFFASPTTGKFGKLANVISTEQTQAFYQGGRVVLFPFSPHPSNLGLPWEWLMNVLERLPHLYILIPVLIFGLFLWGYRAFLKKRFGAILLPPLLWRSLVASCILYVIAWLILFYLYVPERYLQYTLPLIPTFVLGGLIYKIQQCYPHSKVKIGFAATILCLLGTCFFWRADLLKPSQDEKALYAYLKTLPNDVMIAAPPSVASNIPLYSFRSVLMSNEAYIPFHQQYFQVMRQRLKDWLEAYYAVEAAPVRTLVSRYGVDYIVLQKLDFTEKRLESLPKRSYYAFSSDFFSRLKTQFKTRKSILPRSPSLCTVYQNSKFRVIRLTTCPSLK